MSGNENQTKVITSEEHEIFAEMRKASSMPEADQNTLVEAAALQSVLMTPQARTQMIDNVEKMINDHETPLRQRAQLLRMRRGLIETHTKALGVSR